MNIARRILYVISGLALLLSLFVMICSINPVLAVSVTEFLLTGETDAGRRDSSEAAIAAFPYAAANNSRLTEENTSSLISSTSPGSDGTLPGSQDEAGDLLPDGSESNRPADLRPSDYVPPEKTDIQTPAEVSGRNGYKPVEEETEQVDETQAQQIKELAGYGETGEGLTFDEEMYPYYWMLDSGLQELYRQIYANSAAGNAVFSPVIAVDPSQFKTAYMAVFNDHPELFWLESAYRGTMAEDRVLVEVRLSFNRTANDLSASKAAFENEAEEILAGARTLGDDYQKEVYVHDALLDKVRYNLQAPLNQNAYSAMVGEQTVCAGYARAYQYLLQQLGIPCYYCTGFAGENHAWNIVKLDGDYYNVDTTWDDTEPNTYDYFNKTDADFAATHAREELSVYLPACNGTRYAGLEADRQDANPPDNTGGIVTLQDVTPQDVTPQDVTPQDITPYMIQDTAMRTLEDAGFTEQDILTDMGAYYTDCYDHIVQSGGNIQFQNVIADVNLLYACLDAYDNEGFADGYAYQAISELGAVYIEVAVEAEELKDGRFLLYHTVVLTY